MIKIAFVINSLKNRNGAAVFLMNLCSALKRRNDVNFVLISLYNKIDLSFRRQAFANGFEILTCNKKSKFDISSAHRLKTIIEGFDPDVINLHLPAYLTYFMSFGFKKRKWKLVKTYHSIPNQDLSKINAFFEKQYIKRKMISFIAITDSIGELSKKIYPDVPVEIIYNGINAPKVSGDSAVKKYDLVIVASLEEVKNHMLLFRAFERVLVSHPEAKLAVVGDGTKKDEYQRYVGIKGLSRSIKFLGQVDDVSGVLMSSRIFVLSSLREGNPISILEAMSYGLPIVAPSIGGIPDIIDDGVNGLLFCPNDEKQLAHAILMMLDNEINVRNTSKHNIEKSKEFLIDKTADEYVEFFKRIAFKAKE